MEFPERHHTPQNVLLKGFKMFFEACCFFFINCLTVGQTVQKFMHRIYLLRSTIVDQELEKCLDNRPLF